MHENVIMFAIVAKMQKPMRHSKASANSIQLYHFEVNSAHYVEDIDNYVPCFIVPTLSVT